jgi:hypothetical protein
MEAKYLMYLGNREQGKLIIKHEEPDSPYRVVEYYKDMSLRVGVDIPESVANWIVIENKKVFAMITEHLEPEESLEEKIMLLLTSSAVDLGDDKICYIMEKCISNFKELREVEAGGIIDLDELKKPAETKPEEVQEEPSRVRPQL